MTDVARLVLQVDSSQTEKGAKSLEALQAQAGKTEKSTDAMTASTKAFAVAAAAAAVAAAAYVRHQINAADAMNDMHLKTGLAFRSLAAYDLLARQNGTTLESVASGMKFLGRYMTEHNDKLRSIGVTSKDINVAMMQLADVTANLSDKNLRNTLLMEVMSRGGVELAAAMSGGSAAIKKAMEESKRYGEDLEKTSPLADAFNDLLAVMKTNANAFGTEFAGKLLPSMIKFVESLQSEQSALNQSASFISEHRNAIAAVAAVYATVKIAAWLGPIFFTPPSPPPSPPYL